MSFVQAGFHDGEQFQAGMFVDYIAEFKRRCKEKRFTARDFSFDPEKQGQVQLMEEQVRVWHDGRQQQIHVRLGGCLVAVVSCCKR